LQALRASRNLVTVTSPVPPVLSPVWGALERVATVRHQRILELRLVKEIHFRQFPHRQLLLLFFLFFFEHDLDHRVEQLHVLLPEIFGISFTSAGT
jgi:hypothetical protein